jgi:valyl-tRNA synthetase
MHTKVEYLELEGKSKISIPDKNGGKRQVEVGILDSFAYPVVDVNNGHYTGEHLVVSTTRLETIIGDTAVAIHPEDERYKVFYIL